MHEDLVVNHLNGTKSDNRVENLAFVTIAENNVHAVETGLNDNGSEHRNRPIVQLDDNNNVVARYENPHFAHLATGANQKCIIKVCNGHNKTAGGLRWAYTL